MMNPISEGIHIRTGLDLFAKGMAPAELESIYYDLVADREQERLLMESASLEEVDECYNPGEIEMVLEAIVVKKFAQTESKMRALVRTFNVQAVKGIAALDAQIGTPRKSALFATVTVQIPMSDGQVVSIVFHSPSGDEKKIMPDDMIVAFRWLLNKRDITHAVSPEQGQGVSLQTVAKRVMQLVAKNSERFQKSQAEIKAQKDELAAVEQSVSAQEAHNQQIHTQIADIKVEAEQIDDSIETTRRRLVKVRQENDELEARLEEMRKQQQAQVVNARLAELREQARALGFDAEADQLYLAKDEAGLQALIDSKKAEPEPEPSPEPEPEAQTPQALAYIETEGDQTIKDALQIAKGILNTGGWSLLLDTARDVAEPLVEDMVLRFRNTLLADGWAKDAEYGWPLRKGAAQVVAFFEKPGALPNYQLIVNSQGKYFEQTLDVDPADLARRINSAVPAEEPTTEPEKSEAGVLPPADQIDGMPAKRAAKLLHSLGKAEAAMKDGFHIKVKSGAYQDLSIETHADGENRLIYFAQYIEEGGDLIIDSEMVFATNIYTGYLKLAEIGYRGPMGEVRRTQIGRAEKSWANMFSKNLIDQGFETGTEEGEPEPSQLVRPVPIAPEDLPEGWAQEGSAENAMTYTGPDGIDVRVSDMGEDGKLRVTQSNAEKSVMQWEDLAEPAEANAKAIEFMRAPIYSISEPEPEPEAAPNPNAGLNGYIAFYKGKQTEVWAKTSYEAQQKAAAFFKAKKAYDVTVQLAEKAEPEPPQPEPTPEPEPASEPEAVNILNQIIAGEFDSDSAHIDALLDQAAGQLEAAGQMDQYDDLLNQAADHYTAVLKKEAA
jgi:hypothetical protein